MNYIITDWKSLTNLIELNGLDWEGLIIQEWHNGRIIVFYHLKDNSKIFNENC